MKKLLIINGPNLNLLGKREPEIYGNQSFEAYLKSLQQKYSNANIQYFQSNVEGELINALHKAEDDYEGIVLNAGGYTHTSIALSDAVAAINIPVVEVHISNPAAREPFRHTSYLAKNVAGSISGFGFKSYDLAIKWMLNLK